MLPELRLMSIYISDRLLDIDIMDSSAFPGQTFFTVLLSQGLHDTCTTGQDCNMASDCVHHCLGHRFTDSLHSSMLPNPLFLGSDVLARCPGTTQPWNLPPFV